MGSYRDYDIGRIARHMRILRKEWRREAGQDYRLARKAYLTVAAGLGEETAVYEYHRMVKAETTYRRLRVLTASWAG